MALQLTALVVLCVAPAAAAAGLTVTIIVGKLPVCSFVRLLARFLLCKNSLQSVCVYVCVSAATARPAGEREHLCLAAAAARLCLCRTDSWRERACVRLYRPARASRCPSVRATVQASARSPRMRGAHTHTQSKFTVDFALVAALRNSRVGNLLAS